MATQTNDNLIKNSEVDHDSTELTLLEPESKVNRHCTSRAEYIEFLIEEISDVFSNNGNDTKARANLQFYHLVRGGNTSMVRDVLEQLENNAKKGELAWLIVGKCKHIEAHVLTRLLQVVLFIICLVLFIVTSPIFYCVHAVIHNMHEYMRRRPIRNIELPFVYAVMSESKDMIKLFMSYGADLSTTDMDGNNIYHYLADMSSENAEKTIRCNEVLATCFENIDERRAELMTPKNYLNLTAFEAIAKYGSIAFFHSLVESRNSIGRQKMAISEKSVWTKSRDTTFDITSENLGTSIDKTDARHENSEETPTVRVWEFDMSQFEKGDIFGKQSYLLHLLTGRSVDQLDEADVTALYKSKIISKWMKSKTQMYATFCLVAHLVNIAISVLILSYLLLQGGDMIKYPLQPTFFKSYFGLVANNVTYNSTELYERAMVDVLNKCEGHTRHEAEHMVFGTFDDPKGTEETKKLSDVLKDCLIGFIVFQFFTDFLVRLIFLCKNFNFKSSSGLNSLFPLISRWIPGSYAEKLLSSILFLPFFLALYLRKMAKRTVEEANKNIGNMFDSIEKGFYNETKEYTTLAQQNLNDLTFLLQMTSVSFMVCLLLRFFHTIHSMRLLPGIGFFIITTKKMSRHLLQFGIVFGIVMLAFSTMFHLTIRLPECPGVKAEGFSTLSKSLYSTYQVSLGHGDTDHFSYNINSEIAYIACTVIIIIMLLNLIIAVMTTTATDMNVTPWKQVLCLVEMWDEILGVEAQLLCLTLPLRYIRKKCQHLGHKYAKWSIKKKRDVFLVVYYDKD